MSLNELTVEKLAKFWEAFSPDDDGSGMKKKNDPSTFEVLDNILFALGHNYQSMFENGIRTELHQEINNQIKGEYLSYEEALQIIHSYVARE